MTGVTTNIHVGTRRPPAPPPATRGARSAAFRVVALIVVGLIVVGLVGWIALRPTTSHARAAGSARKDAAPTADQRAALDLAYPTPGPTLPPSISIVYAPEHDRTRMTLTTVGLAASAPSYNLTGLTLRWISEFSGKARRPDAGELSVQCVLTGVSQPEGALAASSPPAEFVANAATIEARPAVRGKTGYTSKPRPDGSHESLAFKVRTADLITIANATSVQLKAGVATVPLSPAQIHDLREFVARMNPRS